MSPAARWWRSAPAATLRSQGKAAEAAAPVRSRHPVRRAHGRRRWRDVRGCLETRAGGHRLEAADSALQIRTAQKLDQGAESEVGGVHADYGRDILNAEVSAWGNQPVQIARAPSFLGFHVTRFLRMLLSFLGAAALIVLDPGVRCDRSHYLSLTNVPTVDPAWGRITGFAAIVYAAPLRVRIAANRKAARLLPDAALPRCSTLEMPGGGGAPGAAGRKRSSRAEVARYPRIIDGAFWYVKAPDIARALFNSDASQIRASRSH